MADTLITLLKVCPLVFLAGLIDSMAGGGGIISLPAYMFAGLPIHTAYGTNKLSSSLGTLMATIRFIREKKINFYVAAFSSVAALIGARFGAYIALSVSDVFLKYCLIVLLPIIAVVGLVKKDFISEKNEDSKMSLPKTAVLSAIIGLGIGMYDGFFGPGTGTFLMMAYSGILRLDVVEASGTAKLVNLAAGIGALIMFIIGGKVDFFIGAIAAAFSIAGNWVGSGLAIKKGAGAIRPVFIVVVVLLLATVVYDVVTMR